MSEEGNKKRLWQTLRKEGNQEGEKIEKSNPDLQNFQSENQVQEENDRVANKESQDFLKKIQQLGINAEHHESEDQKELNFEGKFQIENIHHFQDLRPNQNEEFDETGYKDRNYFLEDIEEKKKNQRNTSQKIFQLKSLARGLKLEKDSIIMTIDTQKYLFEMFCKNFLLEFNKQMNNFIEIEFKAMENRIKEQQRIIEEFKVNSNNKSEFQIEELHKQMVYLQKKHQEVKLEHENAYQILKSQNESLHETLFEYEQRMVQLDLEIEDRVEKALKEKKNPAKENYLEEVTRLENQIEKLSEKCKISNEKQEILKQKEQQILLRQNYLEQQLNQIEYKEVQIQRNLEKLKLKQSQLQILEENLYKKMEELDVRENQLYAAKRNQIKKPVIQSVHIQKRRPESRQEYHRQPDMQLQGKCFNKFQQKMAYSRPSSNIMKKTEVQSKATRDFDGHKSQDKGIKGRIGSSSGVKIIRSQVSNTGGSNLNHLGSKLEQLRNEIKKEIQSIK